MSNEKKETKENKKEEVKSEKVDAAEVSKTDNIKVYKILSYLGILWLIGLFVPEKNDKSLKFHVGQGMIVTITVAALYIVVALINNLVIANVFTTQATLWGVDLGYKVTSGFGLTLMTILNLAVSAVQIFYLVVGIKNVTAGQDKELPVIGKFAFYK